MKYLTAPIGFLFALLGAWLAVWVSNILIYILSLPLDLFVPLLLEDAPDIVNFIYYAITTGIIYFLTLLYFIMQTYRCVNKGVHWFDALMLLFLAFVIIVICDHRVAECLHPMLYDFSMWASEELNFYVISGVDWLDVDFSGDKIHPMQYNVFDIAVVLVVVMVLFTSDPDDV